jgi:hypothetical protein
MILLEDAVVVITTNKKDTTLVDELKRAYDTVLNHQNNDTLPEIQVGHRLHYHSEVTNNDSEKISISVDGMTCIETDNAFGGTSNHYPTRLSSRVCFCGKPNKMTNVLLVPAHQPTIIIHVNNAAKLPTCLTDELKECLNVLVNLKQQTESNPIRQLIITKKLVPGVLDSTIKIVGDGQIFYTGCQIWDKFWMQEQTFCKNCKVFGFDSD